MTLEKLCSVSGFVAGIFACVMTVMAFSTPYWMQPDQGAEIATQLEKIGLWEACFKGYTDARDSFGRIYSGCWWIFAREYDGIRKWLLPNWFKLTQGLMTVNVIFSLVSVLLGLMLLIGCLPSKLERLVALAVACLYYAIGIFAIVACVYFGTNASTDRTWLKAPTYRQLAWSFYCAVIGGIIALAGGMCYTVLCLNIWKKGRNLTAYRAHELRHYMPPATTIDHTDHYKEEFRSAPSSIYKDDYRSNRSEGSVRSDYRKDNYRSDRSERSDHRKDNYRNDRSERGDYRKDNYRSDRSDHSDYSDDYRNDGRRHDRNDHRSERSHRSQRNDRR